MMILRYLVAAKIFLRKDKDLQILKAVLMPAFLHVALNKMGQKLSVCNL